MALASAALSNLSSLTTLKLLAYTWLPCITPCLAARLTVLEIGGEEGAIEAEEVAAAVAAMASLRSLELEEGMVFRPEGLRSVLGALQPSVQHCVFGAVHMDDVETLAHVTCSLEDGKLTSFILNDQDSGEVYLRDLDNLLTAILIPSRVLGPTLPRLRLELRLQVWEEEEAVSRGFSALLARCDNISLASIHADPSRAEPERVAATASCLCLPEALHSVLLSSRGLARSHWLCIMLSPRSSDEEPAAPDPSWGDELGRRGSESTVTAASPPPLSSQQLLQCAVAIMKGAAGPPADAAEASCNTLLLRGPAVASLLSTRGAVEAWLTRVAREAARGQPPEGIDSLWFQPIPLAGAVLLGGAESAAVRAAADAVRRTPPQAARGDGAGEGAGDGELPGGGGGAEAEGEIEVVRAQCSLGFAIDAVLQALWDGEIEGAPSPRVGGLDRLRWLARTLQGLQDLTPDRYINGI